MFPSRRQYKPFDVWPGFVDALSTIFIVVVFVLISFIVSHSYLTDMLTGKEHALSLLQEEILGKENALKDSHKRENLLKKEILSLKRLEQVLKKSLASLKQDLDNLGLKQGELKEEKTNLLKEIGLLREQLKHLSENLLFQQRSFSDSKTQWEELRKNLQRLLDEKSLEVEHLSHEVNDLKRVDQGLSLYRSEFFSKLQKIVGDRSDIRIVDDRFIFQSEVLFDTASAELGEEGKEKLDQLAHALKDIERRIPDNINWILRVDGHTDQLPIRNTKFPSNWELSSARAISVVKYLTKKGLSPFRLVAAGFGEHQPLIKSKSPQKTHRNRRIEFKLDQK